MDRKRSQERRYEPGQRVLKLVNVDRSTLLRLLELDGCRWRAGIFRDDDQFIARFRMDGELRRTPESQKRRQTGRNPGAYLVLALLNRPPHLSDIPVKIWAIARTRCPENYMSGAGMLVRSELEVE